MGEITQDISQIVALFQLALITLVVIATYQVHLPLV